MAIVVIYLRAILSQAKAVMQHLVYHCYTRHHRPALVDFVLASYLVVTQNSIKDYRTHQKHIDAVTGYRSVSRVCLFRRW